MNELEKASREYAKRYSSEIHNDGRHTVIPSCTARNSFEAGAQWQSKQSPWISVEERLPEHDNGQSLCEVLTKTCDGRYSVIVNVCVEEMAKVGSVTHWMYISE